MSVDLRYPIGRFQMPSPVTHEIQHQWMTSLAILPRQLEEAVRDLSDAELEHGYRDGGWTVRQIVHHIADSHMNAYIRTRFALTEDEPVVKGYQENLWAELYDARTSPIQESLKLLTALHTRWVALLKSLDDAKFDRAFIHSEMGRKTLRETLGLYAWHGKHHLAHIRCARGMAAHATAK